MHGHRHHRVQGTADQLTLLALAPSGGVAVRASDEQRERVARILQLATGEGLLDLDEAGERIGRAYAARTVDELIPLTADLPHQGRRLLERTPEARAAARAGLRRHAGSVALVALLLLAVWTVTAVLNGEPYYFWPIWPIGFMAFGVVSHARRLGRDQR